MLLWIEWLECLHHNRDDIHIQHSIHQPMPNIQWHVFEHQLNIEPNEVKEKRIRNSEKTVKFKGRKKLLAIKQN